MSFDLDLIIRNGIVVTASDQVPCDIGIKDGKIALLAQGIPAQQGCDEIDAEGGCVTPGGIDSHVHIAQSATKSLGAVSADSWTSGTRRGTTTVIAFAVQNRGMSLAQAAADYHRLSDGHALCDFGFHLIVTDPNDKQMHVELPKMVEQGITSVKIYMTYAALKLNDSEILDVLLATRKYGVTTMVHCENADVYVPLYPLPSYPPFHPYPRLSIPRRIEWMTRSLESRGMTEPWHHGTSRPPIVEAEATHRALALAELMDTPLLIVHVSAPDAVRTIRNAQTRLLPVCARTDSKAPSACARPPLRDDPRDKERVWEGLANGTFTVFSSDHAPTNYHDERGKQRSPPAIDEDDWINFFDFLFWKNPRGNFRAIPNGLPGVETRAPLLWSEGVLKGRITPQRFVELSSTNAAKLYGMYPQKGTIQPGSDADLVIWRAADKRVPHIITNDKVFFFLLPFPFCPLQKKKRQNSKFTSNQLHHAVDYTPFEGFELQDWPRYTLLRGKVVYDGASNKVTAELGYGRFLKRGKSSLPYA
ncbi:hypothetical protein EW146_g9871, partial [Bondarzewia mesenterica]